MVQAGTGDTRLSEISLRQLVQGFHEISKKLDVSDIGTAEGRKGYLQSILIYFIYCLSTLSIQEGEHLLGIYTISINSAVMPYTLPYLWSGREVILTS